MSSLTLEQIKEQVDGHKAFMLACPHADLKTDDAAALNDLSKQAWVIAKADVSKLPTVQAIQAEINTMIAPPKKERAQSPSRLRGIGDAVNITPPQAVKDFLSKITWDGETRLNNPLLLQTVFGADKPIDGSAVRDFYVAAVARLFRPGSPVKALTIGGKRDNVDPLSVALMPSGAGEVHIAALRNLKPERCTFLTVIDGQGKPERAEVLTRNEDTFRRPRAEKEATEARWFSLLVRANAPTGDFIAVSAAPDLALLKQVNDQMWAEAYALFYASVSNDQSGKAAPAKGAGKSA